MAKSEYVIKPCTKQQARLVLDRYHYLSDISEDFKSGYNYGLFREGSSGLFTDYEICGVVIFTGFPVPELLKGIFDLHRRDQDGFFELSRLCLSPEVQESEHNLASWFVARSIRSLRRDTPVRAILSYADADFHNGTIYFACNFKYYGLSTPKKDFFIKNLDGSFSKHSRGKIKGIDGEWRERSRKHRFLLTFDKTLNVKWVEQDRKVRA